MLGEQRVTHFLSCTGLLGDRVDSRSLRIYGLEERSVEGIVMGDKMKDGAYICVASGVFLSGLEVTGSRSASLETTN